MVGTPGKLVIRLTKVRVALNTDFTLSTVHCVKSQAACSSSQVRQELITVINALVLFV